MKTTPGCRKQIHDPIQLDPCDYGFWNADGNWYARSPNGLLGCLAKHQVALHSDGTITASPSILIKSRDEDGETFWHGYLRRGIWEEC